MRGMFENRRESTQKLKAKFKDGKLELPDELAKKIGLHENAEFRIIVDGGRIQLLPNIHSLSKVYIEPTARCNLMCHTCIRNSWDEAMGNMDIKVFDKLINDLKEFESLQTIMFGGFGEPTYHKDFLYMVERAKSLGVEVEIITNGTLLNSDMQKALMERKVDRIWVSFDGTSAGKFEGIREGAKFNRVVDNLKGLKALNRKSEHPIEIGIAFVAMKSNLDELNNINSLARKVGANYVSISNVLPYDKDMQRQTLYSKTLGDDIGGLSFNEVSLRLPRIDINNDTKDVFFNLIKSHKKTYLLSNSINGENRSCRFIDDRCTFIRWDGGVSPCMGLLHSYKTYLYNYEREIQAYTIDNINNVSLRDIWNSNVYYKFREKVSDFNFSPCHICGGCESLESNREDCQNNEYPCCGACMWAYGVIQCP
jgi:MoaA/NifB/PqqE/SkfB family radical SAM enzyme